jgi:M6 family metalloprotease-like protein
MTHMLPRSLLGLMLLLGLIWPLPAADDKNEEKKPAETKLDLSEFKTVAQAKTTTIRATSGAPQGQAGYLGVHVEVNPQGKLVVGDVSLESPAAKAGLHKDDIIVKVADKEVHNPDVFREMLMSHKPGDEVKLAIIRKDKPQELTAKLGATSRPMQNDAGARGPGGRGPGGGSDMSGPTIGLRLDDGKEGEGAPIRRMIPGLPADKAGLKIGDIVVQLDGVPVADDTKFRAAIDAKKPGDVVTLSIKRDGKAMDVKVTLGGSSAGGSDVRGGGSDALDLWKKPTYRLAVICVEFPDAKHNEKIATKEWADSLFSRDTYKDKNSATGEKVYGSLADFYHEVSCDKLSVEGKVFDWVEVKKNRMDYAPGSGTGSKGPLLTEALDKVMARERKDALKDFDGLFFLYAGERAGQNRGSLYWPHRSSVRYDNKNWPYFLCPEGGSHMTNVSLLAHEFGLLLGVPELTPRPDNPGSKGAGAWCGMSNQVENGKPQHFSAWPKEQLGWMKPTVIDPTVPQKLILSPIEGNPQECFKVLIKLDGSEYLLLENRKHKGFDESLPAEGLLIWRVVNNKPTLEVSHGIEGPKGPTVQVNTVPYPSSSNDSFTPYTTPSSQSQLGGGLPVYITNIRRLPDGRITFHIGYEYQ